MTKETIMVPGVNSKWSLIDIFNGTDDDFRGYQERVERDLFEVTNYYPFTSEIIIPTNNPKITKVYETYLLNKELINCFCITKDYCIQQYSSYRCIIVVPFDYIKNGCYIIIDNGIDVDRIPNNHFHFNHKFDDGIQFCAGVPESFCNLRNVILENCRTAENYLIQINLFLNKDIDEIRLIEYSHGAEGRREYDKKRNKYRTK